ncbi:MAG: calcium/sodium antiporter [Patescibacteria group bacterium]|nr:calcium/sodium antiporter [Patescibacteria group bacterium]
MLLFWVIVFIVSLTTLVKSADWLLDGAEKISLATGLSSFVVGIVIVGLGTSFPELVSSLVAVFKDVTEIVPANAVGSNIANILLVVGLSALVSRRLAVTKSLIELDLPLLAGSTVLFLGVAWDRQITLAESIFLLVLFVVYLTYIILHKDSEERETPLKKRAKRPKIIGKDILLVIVGIIGLAVGAKFLIDSVIELSGILAIGAGTISLAAIAFGTSLPELIVSLKAAWQRKPEIALGNIFGSNVFNILLVIGIPGLFKTLIVDEKTFTLGIPVLIVATLLFIISGISRKIYAYEGAIYFIIYIFFIGKLFGFL